MHLQIYQNKALFILLLVCLMFAYGWSGKNTFENDTSNTGSIHIRTSEQNYSLLVDNVPYNSEGNFIQALPAGKHRLQLKSKTISYSRTVTVKPRTVTPVKIGYSSRINKYVSGSYNAIFSDGYRIYFPSTDIGISHPVRDESFRIYWGIVFGYKPFRDGFYGVTITNKVLSDSEITETYSDNLLIHVAFKWYTEIPIVKSILYISPGVYTGFLAFSYDEHIGYYKSPTEFIASHSYDVEIINDHYAGICLKLSAGRRFIFAHTEYSFHMGLALSHCINAGLGFKW